MKPFYKQKFSFKTALIRREENKVEFLERQFHSEKLSFVLKKETEHPFELSLSTCLLLAHFSILKCKTLAFKATT